MVKYRRPAWACPPPGVGGQRRRRRIGDEFEDAGAERIPSLRAVRELDLALQFEPEKALVELDHRVQVRGHQADLELGMSRSRFTVTSRRRGRLPLAA